MSDTTNQVHIRRPWLPILLGLLLFAACLWCAWLIWQQHLASTAGLRAQEAELARLTNLKKDYESLLGMKPCEAREALPKYENIRVPVSENALPVPAAQTSPQTEPAASSAAVPAQTADVDEIESACVFLVSVDGSKVMTGSGFFVAPGYVATNRHVVEAGNGNVLVTSKSMGAPAKGKVVAIAPGDLDFAIVQVPLPQGSHVGILPFAEQVKKTEKIGAWGYPNVVGKNDPAYLRLLKGDLSSIPELSYSEGVVSALLDRKPGFIVHTAQISPGNSGGPLVNANGEVAGINTLISLDEDSYRQASIAISGDDVKKFLSSHGIKTATGKAGKRE